MTFTIDDPTAAQQGQKVFTFSGNIEFVSNKVEAGGEYKVWAEVENQQYKGQWILRPGVTLDMTVGNEPANRD